MSTPALRFHAEDRPAEDVLFTNAKYRVPRYQRPYSWSTDHIDDFWTDLQVVRFLEDRNFVWDVSTIKEKQDSLCSTAYEKVSVL